MTPLRVRVFSLGLPDFDTPKARRRYRVKWRVEGRDRTRSFKSKTEADRLRSLLIAAVAEGHDFDMTTGMPASWSVSQMTWWEWSRDWLALKWPQWSGHSRRSGVESLVAMTPFLLRPGASRPPAELSQWLRVCGYALNDPGPSTAAEANWLERWSVPLATIEPALLESTLTAATTKRDGTIMAAEVVRRRRVMLNAVLRTAVRRGLLERNPMDRVEWRAPQRNVAIDVSTVPSFADVCTIVDHVAGLTTEGARYAALYASVGMAGLRPSEAIALRSADLELPERGWGLARLRGATTSPGRRYSPHGEVHETKGLKQRPRDALREVPLPAQLVQRLRLHVDRFGTADGQVFTTTTGRPPTSTNYGPTWLRARRALWPEGHPLSATTVYTLRRSAATTMLRAGVMPAEVARRLGHSVDVLMRVYASVFDSERERSNALIDIELDGGVTARSS